MANITIQILVRSNYEDPYVLTVEPGYQMTANGGEQYEVLLNQKPLPLSTEIVVRKSDLSLWCDGTELAVFQGWRELEECAELAVASTYIRSGSCQVFSDAEQIGLLALGGVTGADMGADIPPTVGGISEALIQWRRFRERRWNSGYW